MMKGVNFQFTATNKAAPAMQSFQNGLKGVSNQMRSATAANQSFMRGMNDNRRAVQQLGFQIADFSVQVAGGQNKILAFAQQGGQILQFFGAFGAVAGAALAVFAAWAISTDAFASDVSKVAEAIGDLKKNSVDLSNKMEMLRFGVDTEQEAIVLRNIITLERERIKISDQWAATDSLNTRLSLAERRNALDVELRAQREIIAEINAKRDALAQANLINQGMMAVELGHARAIGDAERARVAVGNQIYAGMLAVQGAHQKVATEVKKVEDGMSAAGIAAAKLAGIDFSNITGAADAALKMAQAIDYMSRWDVGGVSSGGGSSYLASQYAQYGAGRKAGETLAAERGSLFGVAKPFLTDKKTKSGGGGKEDPLAELQKQLTLETAILGKTEAQQRIIRALGPDWQKYGDVAITGLTAQIDAIEAFNQKMADQQSIANTIKSSMEDAFMGIVSGTMKAKDAFKSMAASVISELFRVLVVQRLVGSFNSATGTGTGIVGFLGKAFSSFEGGGFTGYGARSGGVDGKGGFPAILHPNETVMDHTQGQGSGVTVVQHNTFGSGVTRAEVQSMIPKIVDATKAAVLDARKRGGSYGSAFA